MGKMAHIHISGSRSPLCLRASDGLRLLQGSSCRCWGPTVIYSPPLPPLFIHLPETLENREHTQVVLHPCDVGWQAGEETCYSVKAGVEAGKSDLRVYFSQPHPSSIIYVRPRPGAC